MFYTIYKITNKLDGKIYIGKHQTKDLNDGYMGSGKHLRYAQTKHGIDNFEKEPITINKVVSISNYLGEELKTKEMLNFTPERLLIEKILSENDKTYHIIGGQKIYDEKLNQLKKKGKGGRDKKGMKKIYEICSDMRGLIELVEKG